MIVLDVGHGQGTKDPDGAGSAWAQERDVCEAVAAETAVILARAGVPTRVLFHGAYPSRGEQLEGLPCDLWVQIHCNAGAPQKDRPATMTMIDAHGHHDAVRASTCILDGLLSVRGLERSLVAVWRTGAADWERLPSKGGHPAMAWPDRGRVCLSGAPEETPAVLVELAHIDQDAHRDLVTTRRNDLAGGLATGVLSFLRG